MMPPADIAGDYNGDGTVDAADYVLWRDSLGQSDGELPADGDNSNTIDHGDYNFWRMNFGNARVGRGSLVAASVPEPASVWLYTGVVCVMLFQMRRP